MPTHRNATHPPDPSSSPGGTPASLEPTLPWAGEQREPAVRALCERARRLGASAAALIPSSRIVVRPELADRCGGEPGCPNHGLAPGCPPHVAGPAGFLDRVTRHAAALVYRVEVPTDVLMTPGEVPGLMRVVQEIAAGVEAYALALGARRAQGFAGGSCKQIFCPEEAECQQLAGGSCRHPDLARPSLSGFGVDTTALMRAAGWVLQRASPDDGESPAETSTLCGLVLVG